MRRLTLGLMMILGGCSAAPQPLPAGPLAQSVALSADANGVPRDLMLAIGVVEGGVKLAKVRLPDPEDHVPVAGVLELRHGAFDSLARGAALMGTDELTLRADTDLGTEAGARVLAELGQQTGASEDDLASWRAAVEELSGMSDDVSRARYAEQVFAILRAGGVFPARDGESIVIAAHPDLTVPHEGVIVEAEAETPDFPGAIWFTTSCVNKCTIGRPDGNASVNTIVIHDTEGGWSASVATLQNDGGKSVHYIIDADGSRVGQFRHEIDTTWHAGNYEYNKHSVGIEHVGVASDPAGYSDGLYEKSAALVKSIRSRWKVPLDRTHIIGHYQIPDGDRIAESSPPCGATLNDCETSANYGGASNHRDPGYHWDWCPYMQRLGGSCTCNDAYSLWNCTTNHKQAVRCSNGKVEIDDCSDGCVSQPIGVNDICQQKADGGGTGGNGGGGTDAGGVVPGSNIAWTPVAGGGGDKADGPGVDASHGGCSVGGTPAFGGAWLLLGAALLLAFRRRAIRRA